MSEAQEDSEKGNYTFDASSRFAFGENWRDFLSSVDSEKIKRSEHGLLELLGKEAHPSGKTFFDIGSGSGLHTLAALRLGATRAVALDYDPNSVVATRQLLATLWREKNFDVKNGNVLLMKSPEEKFDIVYSWGVLHHTGDMWTAIENAAAHVNSGGHFAIAIYQLTPLCGSWKKIKRVYVHSPKPMQVMMEKVFSGLKLTAHTLQGKNPLRILREYERERGMVWRNDVIDWIGGYPYESAKPADVISFVEKLGFKFVRGINTEKKIALSGFFGSGCAEFLFKKES